MVISYQYAEAWGLAPRELVGRELELLFPDLKGYGKYQRSSGPTVEAQSGAFRAKVRGLTRKSILSSAVLLTPDFGEEITRFQFGDGRPSQSSGGLSLLADFDALRQLAAKPSLQASLNARGGVAAELSKTLASLGSLAAGAPQGGSAMLAVFQHFGRLRALAADATLLAALGEGSRDERALARRLRRLPGVPRQDDGDAGAAEGARDWGSRLKVRVARREQLEEVKRAIIAKGYKVRSLQENLDVMARIFAVVDAFLSSFGLIALFVAGLGIANTLIMAVYERTQEIGVMKAVGATQGQIRRAFAFEAAAIGLFGGVLGAASGAAAGFALNRWGVFYIAPGWDGFEFFAPSVALLIGTVGFCTLIGWLAGLYPAYRAARLDPIVALRRD